MQAKDSAVVSNKVSFILILMSYKTLDCSLPWYKTHLVAVSLRPKHRHAAAINRHSLQSLEAAVTTRA